MDKFERPPMTPQKSEHIPDYTPDKLAEYVRDTNGAVLTSMKVLVRGMIIAIPDEYKPWPIKDVKASLDSILRLLKVNITYYEEAGEAQKAQEVREKIERLKHVFSEIDTAEEIPEGFLQKVEQAVKKEVTL